MLLAIVLTIIVIGAAIVSAVYSSILPFFGILSQTANYNVAYYGAIASTERALLSLRYHKAGFEGRSGFSGSRAISGVFADVITGNFGIIANGTNGMSWSITSLSPGSIPMTSGGDIESLMQGTGSIGYNTLAYDSLTELPLYIDTALAASQRYTSGTITDITASNGIYLQGTLRLPPRILASLGGGGTYKLNDNADLDDDQIKDDIMVNWALKGKNNLAGQNFSIIPTIRPDYNQQVPIYDYENAIRESEINNVSDALGTNTPNFFMGIPSSSYEYNVILQPMIVATSLTGVNAIPVNSSVINTASGFSKYLNDPSLQQKTLSFNLVNKLASSLGQIYPFLEYKLQVCENGVGCNVPVSDRYFHIDAAGQVGEYNVHIKFTKPVIKKSNTSDFAIVF